MATSKSRGHSLTTLFLYSLDEPFKASAYAWENLADPETALSGDPTASAFARAMGRKETLWQYYERPEQAFRQRRFGIGMQGIQALQPPDIILNGGFLFNKISALVWLNLCIARSF